MNRPLSATCQPTYNHSRSRKSCDDVGRGDNYCDDDDKDEADDNVDVEGQVQALLWSRKSYDDDDDDKQDHPDDGDYDDVECGCQ